MGKKRMKAPALCGINLGDVGSSKGSFWKKGISPIENLNNVIEDQNDDIKDLKDEIENQGKVIDDLKAQIKEVNDRIEGVVNDESKVKETNDKCEARLNALESEMKNSFDNLAKNDDILEKQFASTKENVDKSLEDMMHSISNLQVSLDNSNEEAEINHDDVNQKLSLLRRMVEELKEKTWELDTTTRNNVVIYGVKEEGAPGNTEWAVREVLRNCLHISRDLPFRKCYRNQEIDSKGIRPVTVQFEKHSDRNAVLNKAHTLVGTGIFISEDFPKTVLIKREKLFKFAKEVHKKRPECRLTLQYDKLHVDNAIYIINDESDQIELLNTAEIHAEYEKSPLKGKQSKKAQESPYVKNRSKLQSKRRILAKSQSTESPYVVNGLGNGKLNEDGDTSDTLDDLVERTNHLDLSNDIGKNDT